MVVDDSRSVHAYVTDILKTLGHELKHVLNGKEGLELLSSRAEGGFDLVLLDWEMPIMTGPAVLDRMREKKILVPVIMMTSKNSISNICFVSEKGAKDYIMKPFTKDILLEKVDSILIEKGSYLK